MPHVGLRTAGRIVAILCAWLAATATDAAAQALAPVGARQLVLPFEDSGRDARGYWLREGIAVLLTDDLTALGAHAIAREDRLLAFERLRVPPIVSLSHATVIRVGQVVGAMQIVIGSFEVREANLTVRARPVRLDTGRMFPEIVEQGPLNDIFAVVGRVARRIVPDSHVSVEQMEHDHPPLNAFEAYVKGVVAQTPAAQASFLNQALELAPEFHRARLALWDVHAGQSEHQRALNAVKPVPAAHALSRPARFLGALSLISLAQYQAAIDVLTELNRNRPDAAVLTALGVAQLRRPAPAAAQRALPFFSDAAKLDPEDADLFFNLGYVLWLQRDLPGAIASLRDAVRRNPADDAAHYVLGVALQAAGSSAESAREKELARQLSSTYDEWDAKQRGTNAAPPGLERLKPRIDASDFPRVAEVIVAAGQRDQRELAAFHLASGRRLAMEERDQEAIAELRRAVYLSPYQSEAHYLLARVYLRGGRTADAVDALKIAIWADPNNQAAKDLLATLPVLESPR